MLGKRYLGEYGIGLTDWNSLTRNEQNLRSVSKSIAFKYYWSRLLEVLLIFTENVEVNILSVQVTKIHSACILSLRIKKISPIFPN